MGIVLFPRLDPEGRGRCFLLRLFFGNGGIAGEAYVRYVGPLARSHSVRGAVGVCRGKAVTFCGKTQVRPGLCQI